MRELVGIIEITRDRMKQIEIWKINTKLGPTLERETEAHLAGTLLVRGHLHFYVNRFYTFLKSLHIFEILILSG